jgi:ABC-type lipoprotein export system ATPase subunit
MGLLEVRGVAHRRDRTFVLRDIDLSLSPATLVVLAGRSGSGKSTLCHLIAGVMKPTTGEVLIDGTHSTDWATVSLLPQRLALEPSLTVRENVLFPAALRSAKPRAGRPQPKPQPKPQPQPHQDRTFSPGNAASAPTGATQPPPQPPPQQDRTFSPGSAASEPAGTNQPLPSPQQDRTFSPGPATIQQPGSPEGLLDRLGLAAIAGRPAQDTSLGEQQRTALARALVLQPRIAVLDEPTAHQDDEHVHLVLDALRAAVRSGTLVIVATHDQRVIEAADQVVRLQSGRITR